MDYWCLGGRNISKQKSECDIVGSTGLEAATFVMPSNIAIPEVEVEVALGIGR